MEPKIEQLPQILCVGVPYYGDNKSGEIPGTWPILNSLSDQDPEQEAAVHPSGGGNLHNGV